MRKDEKSFKPTEFWRVQGSGGFTLGRGEGTRPQI